MHEGGYVIMKKHILLIMFLILISMTVFAQSKPVVVVAPFDAKGVDKDEVEVVTELFTAEYANTGVASVVDRNSFDKIKDQLKFQSSDWSNANKVAQLGKALNANHVVVGQLFKFRTQIAVTIKIIDVNTTTILGSYVEKLTNIEELLDKLPDICTELSEKAGCGKAKKYKIGDTGPGGGVVFRIGEKYSYEVVFLSSSVSYYDAIQIAKNYISNGYGNWRLPKDTEMHQICYNICSQQSSLWGKYWMTCDLKTYAIMQVVYEDRGTGRNFVSNYAKCTNVYTDGKGFEDDKYQICLVHIF